MHVQKSPAPTYSSDWIDTEFSTIDFADARLNDRFLTTARRLAERPQASINQACRSWSEAKAAYRMFANPHLDDEEILCTHQVQTSHRMQEHPLVFAIQDTTYLDFDAHESVDGLGTIGTTHGYDVRGLMLHSTMVVSRNGLPLGLLSAETSARPKRSESRRQRQRRLNRTTIEGKESYRWIEALETTSECRPEGTKVITLADREGDIFEFICRAKSLGEAFIVRSKHNRQAVLGEETADLRTSLSRLTPHTMTIDLPQRPRRPARRAKVGLRFSHVTLMPGARPKSAASEYLPVAPEQLYAVEVKEEHPPARVEPINWLLLTSEPVESVDDALEVIERYKLRWTIEIYHRILKSGCNVEGCRLGATDRLERFVVLKCIIAYRLLLMTRMSHVAPETPASAILTAAEWTALYCRIHETNSAPRSPPSASDAVKWIARLGGFLGRRGDGDPGPTVLWRGMTYLAESTAMWRAMQPDQPSP